MTPNTHTLTPARITSLVLIALVAAGLAYLRFGTGDDRVSVPPGAHAGQLLLHPCTYDTERGGYAADCGTLVVPENRVDPQSRLIALPVTRIRARSPHPGDPIFRLEGGPGLSNMQFAKASRFADHHDVVLVGYRGVDGSSRLQCPEVVSALKHATDLLGEASMRAYADGFRACADRLSADGVDLRGYSIPQLVDDLEAARVALGYRRVDLLSESAGTRTAMIYAWRHPASVHRSVMIGVNPPGNFLWSGRTTDEQIRRYAAACERDEHCSRQTSDLAGLLKETHVPKSWMGLPIRPGNVRIASFYGLMESGSDAAPLSAPMTLGSWISADRGDASGFWFQSVLAGVAFPESFVWGELAAMGRPDAAAARRYFSRERHDGAIWGNPGTRFVWADGRLADAWPATPDENAYSRVRRSNVETLLVGGALDMATPPQIARRELLPFLPNGHQVVLPGFGHTTSFWTEQQSAGTRLVNTFFDSGRVDRSFYKPQRVDFTPEVTQTALGKGFAAAIAGLALLTLASLAWMAVRRRRHGRSMSIVLRAVYPVVLGFGGWFLAVLVVMKWFPGTPLDDELLSVVSVGVPIGLGVFFGWLGDDRKAAGLLAALVGALVGGSLGFNAADGMLALLTTIAAATAGSNLALTLLDVAPAPEPHAAPATAQ